MLNRSARIISRNFFNFRYPIGFVNDWMAESMIKRLMKLRVSKWIQENNSLYFIIYCLENNAEDVLYKNQSFYENLSDEDLASGTEIAFRGLASGLKNEETDFTEMFCPRSLDLEVYQTYLFINILT